MSSLMQTVINELQTLIAGSLYDPEGRKQIRDILDEVEDDLYQNDDLFSKFEHKEIGKTIGFIQALEITNRKEEYHSDSKYCLSKK